MYEGWEYVAATFAAIAVTLGVWFAMIGAKLRRHSRAAREHAQDGTRG